MFRIALLLPSLLAVSVVAPPPPPSSAPVPTVTLQSRQELIKKDPFKGTCAAFNAYLEQTGVKDVEGETHPNKAGWTTSRD